MKLRGTTPPLNVVTVVLPREGEDLVFKFKAVLDIKRFEDLCPEPKLSTVISVIDGTKKPDPTDPTNTEKTEKHNGLRIAYMFLHSITATEGLEWETVNIDDPTTWENYKQELLDSNISLPELGHLITAMLEANGLSEEKMVEARNRFLTQKASGQ